MSKPEQFDERFQARQRLSLDREFKAIFRARRSAAGARIVVYALPNALGYNRLGLVVGRKFGAAVARNRFKRKVREAFRRSKSQQPTGWDWLVLPRLPRKAKGPKTKETVPDATRDEIQSELLSLMKRLARDDRGTGRARIGEPNTE